MLFIMDLFFNILYNIFYDVYPFLSLNLDKYLWTNECNRYNILLIVMHLTPYKQD